jgi:hypothetical protein
MEPVTLHQAYTPVLITVRRSCNNPDWSGRRGECSSREPYDLAALESRLIS